MSKASGLHSAINSKGHHGEVLIRKLHISPMLGLNLCRAKVRFLAQLHLLPRSIEE